MLVTRKRHLSLFASIGFHCSILAFSVHPKHEEIISFVSAAAKKHDLVCSLVCKDWSWFQILSLNIFTLFFIAIISHFSIYIYFLSHPLPCPRLDCSFEHDTHFAPVSCCFTTKSHVYALQQFTDLSSTTPGARELCSSNFDMIPIANTGTQNIILTNGNIKP